MPFNEHFIQQKFIGAQLYAKLHVIPSMWYIFILTKPSIKSTWTQRISVEKSRQVWKVTIQEVNI